MSLDDKPLDVATYERTVTVAMAMALETVIPVAFKSIAAPTLEMAAGKVLQHLAGKGWHVVGTAELLRQLEGMAAEVRKMRKKLENVEREYREDAGR